MTKNWAGSRRVAINEAMGDLFRRRDDRMSDLPTTSWILHGCGDVLFLLVGHLQGDRRVTTSIPAIPEPCSGSRRSRTESCLSGSASIARGSPTTPVIPSAPTQCGRPLCGLWSRLSFSRWCRSPNRRTSLMGWQTDLIADALRGLGAGLSIWSLMGSEGRRKGGGGSPCDSLRPPATTSPLPSEAFFESFSCRSPCFHGEYGSCD